ncbi:hypothetical protein JRO89_XS03G0191500 [Xanthoceras sorbifolium]|uniref:Uncharacterized protein n=1 Tax=Xanthoceras sorbifolium TaxID=99658 RepID=A0ABQ8IAV5_9ROSI|nr:hypothetical protein JRO89_XS03G0191500 [Xanthoceras sorbifolium]
MMSVKNSNLLTRRGDKNIVLVYMTTLFGIREIAKILYDESKSNFSIVLKLLEDQLELAVTFDMRNDTAIYVLARKPSSMFDRSSIGILKMLTYSSAYFYLYKVALKGDLEETKGLLGDDDP